MKNIIWITIDSLSYESLNSYPFKDELFLLQLKNKSISYENVYSDGAFTEAAINGLLCGAKCLDYDNYFEGPKNCPTNIFSEVKKRGYKIYNNLSLPYPYGETWQNLSDTHKFVEVPFYLRNVFQYRCKPLYFKYKRCIPENVKLILFEEINQAFAKTISFYSSVVVEGDETSLYNSDFVKEDCINYIDYLYKEHNKFLSNKDDYLNSLCDQNIVPFENIVLPANYKRNNLLQERLHRVYDTAKCKAIHSVKNQHKYLRHYFMLIKKHFSFNSLKHLFMELHKYHISDSNNYFSKKQDSLYQKVCDIDFYSSYPLISFKEQINDALLWIRANKNERFFIYLQPQDFHCPCSFWNYSNPTDYKNNIDVDGALSILNRLPRDYAGNPFEAISLNYIDSLIKKFYDSLVANSIIDDCVFVIASDHGCTSLDHAKRIEKDDYMFLERCHVPFFIYYEGCVPSVNNNFYHTYGIPNTVLKASTGNVSLQMESEMNYYSNYVLLENLGFGCPDMEQYINFTFINKDYRISNIVSLNDHVNLMQNYAYHLKKDPFEQFNIHVDDKALNINEKIAARIKKIKVVI